MIYIYIRKYEQYEIWGILRILQLKEIVKMHVICPLVLF